MTRTLGPRLVVAGVSSGVGKTTVATGLMAALSHRGLSVSCAKVGPDFIDPGYHALATGRPGRNLDSWICGEDAVAPLAGRAAQDTDVLIVEGVMGLFDGASDGDPVASTASIARLLEAPVVLVVDASSMSSSVAAIVHGFATLDPEVQLAGVVLNRVGSDGHARLLREALVPLGIPVLGILRRDDQLTWRDRHLGLVPVVEHPEAIRRSLDRLAHTVTEGVDLEAVMAVARRAPSLVVDEPARPRPQGRARVAVARGPAFSFVYRDNEEALTAAGAELVPFDPLVDTALPPAVTGLVVGGGFPEVFAPGLSDNTPLLADLAERVHGGLALWAECGGLLWLARSLDGHPLSGIVPAEGQMTDRLTLGYRRATVLGESPLGPAGTQLRGHEFHYSAIGPTGEGLEITSRFGTTRAGFVSPRMFASYLHLHMGGDPTPAERFVAAAHDARAEGAPALRVG